MKGRKPSWWLKMMPSSRYALGLSSMAISVKDMENKIPRRQMTPLIPKPLTTLMILSSVTMEKT